MIISLLLAWVLFPAFPHLAQAEPPQQSPQQPSSNDKDLCSYLKDVEAKSDADCGQEVLTALKSQDPAGYSQKLELARKRKPGVLKAYELLKAQPSLEAAGRKATGPGDDPAARHDQETPPGSSKPNQSVLPQLDPPINERTFPAWIGPAAKDLKEVYTRWLKVQNQELQQEKGKPVSPERRKEIDAAFAANQAKIAALGRINDPAELSCFLGEACGRRSELSDPVGPGAATGKGSWTKADYERANAEAKGKNFVPGGKLDRGMPTIGAIASEVVGNTPLGPLNEKPADGKQSGMRTVATVALAATGALLLFGGLGGKLLEEKLPNIRRDMGIAAGLSGVVAAGALSLSALSASFPSLPTAAPAIPQLAWAGAGGTGGSAAGGALVLEKTGEVLVAGTKAGALIGAAKLASDHISYSKSHRTGESSSGSNEAQGTQGSQPSLENPESLRGADPSEVENLIPKDWVKGPMKKGAGTRYLNPRKPGESILVEEGWPGASDPLHRGPYVRISGNGQITRVPLKGNPSLP